MYIFELKSAMSAAERILMSNLVNRFAFGGPGCRNVEVAQNLTAILSKERTVSHKIHGIEGELDIASKGGQLVISSARNVEGAVQWERIAVIKYEKGTNDCYSQGSRGLTWIMSEMVGKSGSASEKELLALRNMHRLSSIARGQFYGFISVVCGKGWVPADRLFDVNVEGIEKLVSANAGLMPKAQQIRLAAAIVKFAITTYSNNALTAEDIKQAEDKREEMDRVFQSVNGYLGAGINHNALRHAVNDLRWNDVTFGYNDTRVELAYGGEVVGVYTLEEVGMANNLMSGFAGLND